MSELCIHRREVLQRGLALGALGTTGARQALASDPPARVTPAPAALFPVSFNTSTLRGQKLPLVELVEIVAKAGYQGIEPWMDELDRHVESGGSLKDIGKRIRDHGLKVTGGIAFFEWMVDDESRRKAAFEHARQRFEQFSQIGATHLAAPPAGDVKNVSLLAAAERYRALLEMAADFGIVPAVEIWGPAANVCRLGQAVCIALEAHHLRACILPDVYHLHRGGSGLADVGKLNGGILAGFHLNDYPASPPAGQLKDADRVYPGDGVAPLKQLFRDLRAIGYRGAVSIELFNPEYYKQDPMVVARTALEKTRRVMEE
ncbi:MAG TPA: sugar phosphate isomerase/epimerase [Phycisphaerae bacterium]|nr:sugar phosphate isomerase/epimerase [Phycisphaerae bacterium]